MTVPSGRNFAASKIIAYQRVHEQSLVKVVLCTGADFHEKK